MKAGATCGGVVAVVLLLGGRATGAEEAREKMLALGALLLLRPEWLARGP